MPLTIQCPGCGSSLTAPDRLAGHAVRCTRCGQPMRVPAVLDAEAPPAAPVRVVPVSTPIASPPPKPAPVVEPPRPEPVTRKRPSRKRTDDEELEKRSVRRPRSRGRFPLWIPIGGGVLVLLLLTCVVSGLYFGLRDHVDVPSLGPAFGDDWVRMEPAGTQVAWEFPAKPALGADGVGGGMPGFGENLYGCELKQLGRESIIFTAILTNHAAFDSGKAGFDLNEIMRELNAAQENRNVIRTYQIQGRAAILSRVPIAEKIHLLVTEPGRTYQFEAFGPGVTETHPTAKRFIDSVRFRDGAPPPLTSAAKAMAENLPPMWSRVKVNGDTALTIAMPNAGLAPGVQRQHPSAKYRVCYHGRLATANHGEMTFMAEFFTENPINIDPNSLPPDQRPVKRYQVSGHEVWVNKPRDYGDGVTHVPFGVFAENGKIVMCDVSGKGITLDTPEVRRCIDSISFALPATPGVARLP